MSDAIDRAIRHHYELFTGYQENGDKDGEFFHAGKVSAFRDMKRDYILVPRSEPPE